jgi:hypothetical protein
MKTVFCVPFAAMMGLLAITTMVAQGCMRSIEVPRTDLDSAKVYDGTYRVETDSMRFVVHDFATTDSTLVITRLSGEDRQFGRLQMPVTIPMVSVKGVYEQKVDAPKTGLIVVGSLAVIAGTIAALWIAGTHESY